MYSAVFTFAAGLFLLFYGCCLLGWPMDVARGIGWLERKSRRTRGAIGIVMMGAGLAAIILQLIAFRE